MARHISFEDATLCEAVRLIEDDGPLDDAQAMREAMAAAGAADRRDEDADPDPEGRIVLRARRLGQRTGLLDAMARARSGAPWVLLGIVALVVLAGLSLSGNVLGGGERRINVVVALTSLLGLHLITLFLWLLGLLLPLGDFHVSFGWLWATLTARVAGGRRGQAPLLLRAITRQLSGARLLPWALGLASHAIWTLSFAVALAAMVFALAFRSYQLNWETTILDPDFFVASVRWLGHAPAWLGFPVPDAQAVLSPLGAASAQRAWALWLTGCIVVYGLLPRLFFALLCAGVCRARRAALRPDLSQPYYRRLRARFEALEPRHVVDADPGRAADGAGVRAVARAEPDSDAWVAVGFELPDELPWPPTDAEFGAAHSVRVDGSAGSLRDLLDLLARIRPRRVVIGCRASSRPDRGTERFLREVSALAGDCRLRLVGAASDDGAARANCQAWQAWLAGAELRGMTLSIVCDPTAAAATVTGGRA